jgi:hypothetical protein
MEGVGVTFCMRESGASFLCVHQSCIIVDLHKLEMP